VLQSAPVGVWLFCTGVGCSLSCELALECELVLLSARRQVCRTCTATRSHPHEDAMAAGAAEALALTAWRLLVAAATGLSGAKSAQRRSGDGLSSDQCALAQPRGHTHVSCCQQGLYTRTFKHISRTDYVLPAGSVTPEESASCRFEKVLLCEKQDLSAAGDAFTHHITFWLAQAVQHIVRLTAQPVFAKKRSWLPDLSPARRHAPWRAPQTRGRAYVGGSGTRLWTRWA
jgi:hypothetical protein